MAVKEKIKEFKEKHPELKGEATRILYLSIVSGIYWRDRWKQIHGESNFSRS